jgi:hypothetical protein
MKHNRWSKPVAGETASEDALQQKTTPFVASPLALSQPGWQGDLYRQAYEQARLASRPPMIEQVTARSAN